MNKYKITGYTLDDRNAFTASKRVDYTFVVEFSNWKDHEKLVSNYLEWYCGVDLKQEESILWQLQTNETCALALVVFYLRNHHKKLLGQYLEYCTDEFSSNPIEEGANYKLWISREEGSDVFTERQAAGELIKRCKYRKLSHVEAKQIVRSEFPDLNYDWEKVMSNFRKLGGKHTKLYLRYD